MGNDENSSNIKRSRFYTEKFIKKVENKFDDEIDVLTHTDAINESC
jgi:hypothetical protein